MRSLKGVTLIELIVVFIIVGILVAVVIPTLQGMVIKARITELYNTVGAIERAEEKFFRVNNHYAAVRCLNCSPDQWLLYYGLSESEYIQRYKNVLGLDIPGTNSTFVYEVNYSTDNDVRIYVYNRETFISLCYKQIGGSWWTNDTHPWARYLNVD